MYTKKFVFSAGTIPAMVFMNHAADFQKRRRVDKDTEGARRLANFAEEPTDITPKNGGKMIWAGTNAGEFE